MQKLKAIEQLKEQAAAGKQLEKNQVIFMCFMYACSHYHSSPFHYKQLFNQVGERINLRIILKTYGIYLVKYFYTETEKHRGRYDVDHDE